MKKLALLSLAVASCAAFAGGPVKMVPQAAPAPDYWFYVDANGNQVGPSNPILGVGEDFTPNNVVWDSYEADPAGAGNPTEFRLPNFGINGGRYIYGANCPDVVDDFTVANGTTGHAATRLHWLMYKNEARTTHRIIFRLYDDFNTSSPAAANFVSGVGYSWTALNNGFYYVTSDLGAVRLRMPADGSGAVRMTMVGTDNAYGANSQPGFWFIKSKDENGNPRNIGTTGNFAWVDVSAPIGSINDFASFSGTDYEDQSAGTFPGGLNINQEPFSLALGIYNAASIATIEGTELSGGLVEVDKSDNTYYQFFPDEFTLRAVAEFAMFVPAPNSTTPELKVDLEYNVQRLGLAGEISVLKPVPGTWTIVDGFTATGTDSTRSVTITGTNATDHINAAPGSEGQVKIRVTFQPINDEDPAQDGWEHNIDLLKASTNI